MKDEGENFQLWMTALTTSETLVENIKNKQVNKENLLTYLASLDEIFSKNVDPAVDFHGFVLIQLCKALHDSIKEL
ncbi:MAG: hypothetical protein L6Q37_06245 [Bdellovibrionaceae bacterium]|nr:hypothetical protein [Pseudobdellovibrionaceae bacterium]NUM60283.1 hypothetical protein [Pseudobdellovibrionaceae bacterium]